VRAEKWVTRLLDAYEQEVAELRGEEADPRPPEPRSPGPAGQPLRFRENPPLEEGLAAAHREVVRQHQLRWTRLARPEPRPRVAAQPRRSPPPEVRSEEVRAPEPAFRIMRRKFAIQRLRGVPNVAGSFCAPGEAHIYLLMGRST